jgi:hypothetical protein
VKKIAYIASALALAALAGAQLVLPDSFIAPASSEMPLLAGSQVSPAVGAIIERSCQNCHSLKTELPLYGRIFPVSLLLEHDVQAARSNMNLSRWQSYADTEKSALLSEIGSVVRNHVMPPRRYTLIHPAAKLSDADAALIYQWTRAERQRLRKATEPPAE